MNPEEMSLGFSVLCSILTGSSPLDYWGEVKLRQDYSITLPKTIEFPDRLKENL